MQIHLIVFLIMFFISILLDFMSRRLKCLYLVSRIHHGILTEWGNIMHAVHLFHSMFCLILSFRFNIDYNGILLRVWLTKSIVKLHFWIYLILCLMIWCWVKWAIVVNSWFSHRINQITIEWNMTQFLSNYHFRYLIRI